MAEMAGADGIVIHLREDRRHIQDRDLRIIRETVQTSLNLEMALTHEMVHTALEAKPDMVTLVPERREERTTEGGLDVALLQDSLKRLVDLLLEGDIMVSMFIDPDIDQIRASHKLGAQAVELHTGYFCDAHGIRAREHELSKIIDAAKTSSRLGLQVAAGHGLHYDNVGHIARLPEIEELNIGHSIISRAVLVGIDQAVREMIQRIQAANL